MNFADFREKLKAIGRAITPDTVIATRDLIVPLYAGSNNDDVKVERDVRYGPDERHRLDVFTPAGGFDFSRPVLVFVHGGGFLGGDKHTEGSPFYSNVGQWAVRNGCNGVTITYRLSPQHRWPSGVEDLRLVVEYLQDQGAKHGLSGSKIFFMGQSAGAAHVAGYIAHAALYAPKPHGLTGMILLSGIYEFESMPPSPMEPAYLGEDRSVWPARSSLKALAATEIPMLVTVAEFDPPQFEKQTLNLIAAVQASKGQMPWMVYARGQNHISMAQYFGLAGDLVAPQVKAFIDLHG